MAIRTRLAQTSLSFFAALVFLTVGCSQVFGQIRPPQQPASGPGGVDGTYKVRESTYGSGGEQYWLFEPEPLRGSAPVIVFLHGWNAMRPGGYRLWIDHLVQRGNIVIYPKYQGVRMEAPRNVMPNTLAAIRAAFDRLGNRADRSKVAVVGHSVGAILSFNVAAESVSAGLPPVRAVMSIDPADTDINPLLRGRVKTIRETDQFGQIPRNILALVVVGDEDKIAGQRGAQLQFNNIKQVPCENKNYIVMRSDRHGNPALVANHFAAAAAAPSEEAASQGRGRLGGRLLARGRANQSEENIEDEVSGSADALDFYGYWKLLDGLTDAAFYNRNREYALGGGQKQTFMGNWSDGRPVQSLVVSNDPGCRR